MYSTTFLKSHKDTHYLVQLTHRIPTLKALRSVRLSPHRLEDLHSELWNAHKGGSDNYSPSNL